MNDSITTNWRDYWTECVLETRFSWHFVVHSTHKERHRTEIICNGRETTLLLAKLNSNNNSSSGSSRRRGKKTPLRYNEANECSNKVKERREEKKYIRHSQKKKNKNGNNERWAHAKQFDSTNVQSSYIEKWKFFFSSILTATFTRYALGTCTLNMVCSA